MENMYFVRFEHLYEPESPEPDYHPRVLTAWTEYEGIHCIVTACMQGPKETIWEVVTLLWGKVQEISIEPFEKDHPAYQKYDVEGVIKRHHMRFYQTYTWGNPAVPEIPRSEIETCYSFTHYDGPATGLVYWKGHYALAVRFEMDQRFWLVKLTPEQQVYALEYGKTWAEYFHNGCVYKPDGERVNGNNRSTLGKYEHFDGTCMWHDAEGEKLFQQQFPTIPTADREAEVLGYFWNWRNV